MTRLRRFAFLLPLLLVSTGCLHLIQSQPAPRLNNIYVDVWAQSPTWGEPEFKVPEGQVVNIANVVQARTNADGNVWAKALKAVTQTTISVGRPDYVFWEETHPVVDGLRVTVHLKLTNPPQPPKPVYPKRTGVVHRDGRSWVDDQGEFYPLGETLMWALRGQKFEPQRVRDNVKYVADKKFDFVRILGEVGWSGNDIVPCRWDDYEQVLASFLDMAYDDYGVRTELTLVGGGTGCDYMDLARKVVRVVRQRPEKVLALEVSNEGQIKDARLMLQLVTFLHAELPQHFIAATDAGNGIGFTAPPGENPEVYGTHFYFQSGATYATVHLSRETRLVDGYWRHVRQSWDFKNFAQPMSHNEPCGPRSSVAECTQPIHLVMSRAVGILNGLGAYVLHNGAGVSGQVDAARNRPANLWEVPGIGEIMDRLRALDTILPRGAMNGLHYRCCDQREHPLVSTNVWTGEGADPSYGVVRDYATDRGDGTFLVMPIGIKDHADMVAARACTVRIIDPLTLSEETRSLNAGERLRLVPSSRDEAGMGAFVIVGSYR